MLIFKVFKNRIGIKITKLNLLFFRISEIDY